jgi:hypothetical protein
MANVIRKTTDRHFEIFKAEALKAADSWGLNDIKLYFHHGQRDARASMSARHIKRVATITLSTEWEECLENEATEVTDEEIRETARHEVIHVLILPLACLIGDFCTKDEAESAEEQLVQRLMRLLPPIDPSLVAYGEGVLPTKDDLKPRLGPYTMTKGRTIPNEPTSGPYQRKEKKPRDPKDLDLCGCG